MVKNIIDIRLTKKDREKAVLIGLVDLYIKTNQPVGSNSLRISGFDFLSSATIRNYFNKWEKEGFLIQQHSSGGRIPTNLAYREYINFYQDKASATNKEISFIQQHLKEDTKEVNTYLQKSCDLLCEMTQCSTFIILPRFDQDYIQNIHLLDLEKNRLLFVIVTDFGQIHTQQLHTPRSLTQEDLEKIRHFFLWKLTKRTKPVLLDKSLAHLAQYFYNEIVVRHILQSTNSSYEDIYKTGLSKLLNYPEFEDPNILTSILSFFEDSEEIRSLLVESMKINRLTSWVGHELNYFSSQPNHCTVIAIPYHINQRPIGALSLLGPSRIAYKKLFGLMKTFSETLSENLTKNIYKYKLSFHQKKNSFLSQEDFILLEDKTKQSF